MLHRFTHLCRPAILQVLVLTFILAPVYIQNHYDVVCNGYGSPQAVFKLDGVYCKSAIGDTPLSKIIKRHRHSEEIDDCKSHGGGPQCDPRFIAPPVEWQGS